MKTINKKTTPHPNPLLIGEGRKRLKAFTLVELIIVITILAILATIAFVSFQGYTKDARDGNRVATITQIQKGLELSVLKTAKYPNPDEVYGTGIYEPTTTPLNYVGYIGENISRLINMNKIPLDPVTENKYVYGVSANHQKYQLATTLENLQTNTLIPTTYTNGTQARVTGNYTYPLRLGGYLYSLPSLIFVGSGITSTGFVIDKGFNLPYKLNSQTPENTQTITTQLQQLTGTSATLIFTGVQIPTLTSEEFKNLTEIPEALLALGISNKDILGTAIFGNSYFSEKSVGSSSSSSCPTGYILVPGNPTFSTSDFCVMKYEAKDVGGVATSQAAGTPWVSITQPEAISACDALNNGDGTNNYHLITNNEWMTIARNIEANAVNWEGGEVGTNYIYSGHNDNNPANSLAASTDDNDGYNGTGNSSGNQKRTHTLSNGQVIWDLAGNVWEHVNGTNNISSTTGEVTNGQACSTTTTNWYAFTSGETTPPAGGTCSFVSPYSKANHGPAGNYNANNGVGRIYSSTATNRIFIRGGYWHNPTYAGVFSLNLGDVAGTAHATLGFRCAFSVN